MREWTDPIYQYAVVDIGANSVRMNIYAIDTQTGDFSVCASARSMLGLAAYVENGTLTADGAGKLFAVIREFLARANSIPCDRFSAFATASLRGLSGSEKIVANIRAKLGVEIEIISGETEARYDFDAIRYRFPGITRGVIIDMGGGSTEIITFTDGKIQSVASLAIGCVRLMKSFTACTKHDPFPNNEEITAIRQYTKKVLSSHPEFSGVGGSAFLIGGTARAAAKIHAAINQRGNVEDGYSFSQTELKKAADAAFHDARRGGKKLRESVPDRLITILPGLAAYEEIAAYMGLSDFIISTAGVREGYLLSFIQKSFPQRFQEI